MLSGITIGLISALNLSTLPVILSRVIRGDTFTVVPYCDASTHPLGFCGYNPSFSIDIFETVGKNIGPVLVFNEKSPVLNVRMSHYGEDPTGNDTKKMYDFSNCILKAAAPALLDSIERNDNSDSGFEFNYQSSNIYYLIYLSQFDSGLVSFFQNHSLIDDSLNYCAKN